MKTLPGSDGEVNVHEDVSAIAKQYKNVGDSIPFTATLNCAYDPDKQQQPARAVDVVVETISEQVVSESEVA